MTKAVLNGMKKGLALCLAAVLVLALAGCGDKAPRKIGAYKPYAAKTLESGTVAENDRFVMTWDGETACVMIEDKVTGKVWSPTPNDYYTGGFADPETEKGAWLFSALNIEIINPKNNNRTSTASGSMVLTGDGRFSAEKTDNGMMVVYFFDKDEIAIPLVYRLCDDHFTVTVDTKNILEGKFLVYSVSITPYMASTVLKEERDKSSYLVVPSGSGALMYGDRRTGSSRDYKEAVYGYDYARLQDALAENICGATMPVFGVNDGQNALLGIIEEGAACCSIEASAGDDRVGYSCVYPNFALRGQNVELIKNAHGATNRIPAYSDGFADTDCTVAYYPLDGSEGYIGMAKRYRRYLQETAGMKDGVQNSPLYLQMIGGASVDRSAVGVPYTKLVSATTVKQAKAIARDVYKNTGLEPVIQLKGYGSSGDNIGALAGDLKVDSVFGTFGDIKSLQKEFKQTYLDFDVIRFTKSAAGYSYSSDGAKAENSSTAYRYTKYAVAMENGDDEEGKYHFLRRDAIDNLTDKVVQKLRDESLSGVSLSTIGAMAYSDYRDPAYYNKAGMDRDVSKALTKASEKLSVMTQSAYAYAAAHADHVLSAPSSSSRFNSLDVDIPFYQAVFGGAVSMSGASITLAIDPRDTFLQTLSMGSGLLFTATDHYNDGFIYDDGAFAASVYDGQKEQIAAYTKEAAPFLNAVMGCTIEGYEEPARKVTKTTFSNGTVIIVNRSSQPFASEWGTVQPGAFIYR